MLLRFVSSMVLAAGCMCSLASCQDECDPDNLPDGAYEATLVAGFDEFELVGATGHLADDRLEIEISTGGGWTVVLEMRQTNERTPYNRADVHGGLDCLLPETPNAEFVSLTPEPGTAEHEGLLEFWSQIAFACSLSDDRFFLSDVNPCGINDPDGSVWLRFDPSATGR